MLFRSELFRESQAPCRAVCRPCGYFRMMHGGVSSPSCCVFTHRVAFKEVSGCKRGLLRMLLGSLNSSPPWGCFSSTNTRFHQPLSKLWLLCAEPSRHPALIMLHVNYCSRHLSLPQGPARPEDKPHHSHWSILWDD